MPAHDAGADPTDRGYGAAVRPGSAPDGPGARRRRRVRRGADLLPVSERAAQPRVAGRVRRWRRRRPDRDGARDRRPHRPGPRQDRRLLAWDAPADRDRRRAAPRPEAAAARRAGDRSRSRRDARHAAADPPPGRPGDDRAAVEPPARRGRGAVQPGGDRPQGEDRLRGRDRRPETRRRRDLPAVEHRRRARAGGVPGAAGDRRHPDRPREDLVHRRRAGGRRPVAGADRGGRADHFARAAVGHARGPVLLADRGRGRRRWVPRGGSARGAAEASR